MVLQIGVLTVTNLLHIFKNQIYCL